MDQLNSAVSSFRKVAAPGVAEHLQLHFAFLQRERALVLYVTTMSAEGSPNMQCWQNLPGKISQR